MALVLVEVGHELVVGQVERLTPLVVALCAHRRPELDEHGVRALDIAGLAFLETQAPGTARDRTGARSRCACACVLDCRRCGWHTTNKGLVSGPRRASGRT